jgi:twitching motility protein PilJ
VGSVAYFTAGEALKEQILQNERTNANDLQDKLNIFIDQRYEDIVELSKLDSFTNPKVRDAITMAEKNAMLKDRLDASVYDSIAVYNPTGKLLGSAGGEIDIQRLIQVDYSQIVLQTNRPALVDPRQSTAGVGFSFFIAAPVKDKGTDQTTALVRTRTPMTVINDVFGVDSSREQAFYLTDSKGQITASSVPDAVEKQLTDLFPNFATQIQHSTGHEMTTIVTENGKQQILTYLPNTKLAEAYGLRWGLVVARPTAVAFAPQQQLLLTVVIGTTAVALLVAVIAAYVANRATRPILAATTAVERIGQGELDTRVEVRGEDELSLLGVNINNMAGQIKTLLREQAFLAEEQRRQKEELQERALQLLEEVDPINEGDLTVRARVTEDDIGTIADAYNATVTNLREIVSKVQATASNVTETTKDNATSIQSLSKEALSQAERISIALEQVKQMAESVRLVAMNAERASVIVQRANQTVQEGDTAMNRTVDGINAIRETVAETRQKVKYLGESSQRITAVVNLIGSFAAQTKLLAFNASIEANRAGQEGRGFAVVAEEVRSLAQQSAEASTEIEKLVTTIQGETNEVIAAMEAGTEQVVIGTRLVEETRHSLNKITAASAEISDLVSAISQATTQQSSASEAVTHTMVEVAAIANQTFKEADRVAASFEQLQSAAAELQQHASRFKVR